MNFLRNNATSVVSLAVLLLIALYLWIVPWVSTSFGPIYGPKALSNPFLAFEKYLEGNGFEIKRENGWIGVEEAMSEADVILMSNQNGDLTSDQQTMLFDWVDQGGKLIYEPLSVYWEGVEDYDAVLTALDLKLMRPSLGRSAKTPPAAMHHAYVPCQELRDTVSVDFRGSYYWVDFPTVLFLEHSANESMPKTSLYVEEDFMHGTIFIMTGMRQWRNNVIQCHDNAKFLYDMLLADSTGSKQLVWVDSFEVDPLYQQLWQWVPETLITLCVLLFFWLWNRIPRVHLTRAESPEHVNSLEDYLLGRAAFRWKRVSSLNALNALRDEVAGEYQSKHDLPKMADQSGLTREEVSYAMTATMWPGKRKFTEIVATLNQMRGKID